MRLLARFDFLGQPAILPDTLQRRRGLMMTSRDATFATRASHQRRNPSFLTA
ncbi:hypothetical protein [Paracoccus sp. T5]|uniref:hypothetical protein n=1 Tax=Paracoccus sp. T5 TaxID=3402161 RepID=UPI003AD926DB